MNLSDIRYKIERYTKATLDNELVVDWANDAQSDILMTIDINAQTSISVSPDELTYSLPVTDIKRINRLWLQSEHDQGIDRDISNGYRIYEGNIIFNYFFSISDTLNIDYYKHMTYFTDITDTIDLDDRYSTLYTTYGIAQYYDMPDVIERLGELPAKRQYEKNMGRYMNIRDQIAAYYTMQLQPSTIKEVY